MHLVSWSSIWEIWRSASRLRCVVAGGWILFFEASVYSFTVGAHTPLREMHGAHSCCPTTAFLPVLPNLSRVHGLLRFQLTIVHQLAAVLGNKGPEGIQMSPAQLPPHTGIYDMHHSSAAAMQVDQGRRKRKKVRPYYGGLLPSEDRLSYLSRFLPSFLRFRSHSATKTRKPRSGPRWPTYAATPRTWKRCRPSQAINRRRSCVCRGRTGMWVILVPAPQVLF